MRLLSGVCVLLAACAGPALPNPFEVQDLRVVSMVAEPPELAPGETLSLTARFADPSSDARSVSVRVYQCADLDETACAVENTPSVTLSEGQAEREQADVYRYQFNYTVPADIFDTASIVQARYGISRLLLVRANNGLRDIDGFKRVVVTSAMVQPKNRNPAIVGFEILKEGTVLGTHATVELLERGGVYELRPQYDRELIEDYVVLDFNGELVPRREEASFVWSCSPRCSYSQRISYDDDVTFVTTPEAGAEDDRFTIHVALRDGRGGQAFFAKTFRLVPRVDLGGDGE